MTEHYTTLQLGGIPDQSVLLDALKSSLPQIAWRPGDSDAQGKYIQGHDSSNADIAFWLGEDPAILVIDSRRVEPQHRSDVDVLEQTIRAILANLEVSIISDNN